MLDQALKDQVRSLFEKLKSKFTLLVEVNVLNPKRQELVDFLEEVAGCSEQLECLVIDGEALAFSLLQNGQPSSIRFRAIPAGHEFSTLLLAILNMDGIGKNLPDEVITRRVQSLSGKVHLQSYISLSCTNCPDVAQALNAMAIINPLLHHEIIDGGLYAEEVERLNIQAVPSVYLNGELFHVGRSSFGELLAKLEEKLGSVPQPISSEIKQYDVLVAGGGPAGVSAAIYSARKGLKVALVADHVGGQVAETMGIENMISVSQTTGSHLVANMQMHLADYSVDILENRKIELVELVDGQKQLTTSMGEKLVAPALIIVTGASWRRLNIPGEQQYIGSGVAFCAHCDGPFYKGKKVAVVGGGNSGLEAAIDLSTLASEVTVIEYMNELKGDQILQDKLNSLPNVRIRTGVETVSISGDGAKVNALNFRNRADSTLEQLNIDGVFVQIGLIPNSQLFRELVELNQSGEILIDAHCRTGVPGIYAAGDVSSVPFKQIVIAMGEGSKAALTAFEDRLMDRLLAN